MESKIMIDINYASRDPQIVIRQKDSDDPRDKLVSMFTGQSMPGVRDGYCKIERYAAETNGEVQVVITPIHPVELIRDIPYISELAHTNASCDTTAVPERYRKIIEAEYSRLGIGEVHYPELTYAAALEMVDHACVEKLPPDVYKKWKDIMFDYPQKSLPKHR